jgi:hypothetical protein
LKEQTGRVQKGGAVVVGGKVGADTLALDLRQELAGIGQVNRLELDDGNKVGPRRLFEPFAVECPVEGDVGGAGQMELGRREQRVIAGDTKGAVPRGVARDDLHTVRNRLENKKKLTCACKCSTKRGCSCFSTALVKR